MLAETLKTSHSLQTLKCHMCAMYVGARYTVDSTYFNYVVMCVSNPLTLCYLFYIAYPTVCANVIFFVKCY